MFWRIGGTIIAIGIVIVGFFHFKGMWEERRQDEYRRYAGAITEISVAAELYRNKIDSFPNVRDSILRRYGVTLDEMRNLKTRFGDNPSEWARFWKVVTTMTDSAVVLRYLELAELYQARIKKAADSTHSDSI